MVLTSVVGKALEKFYNSKYKDLKDEDREKKVSEHLKALLPTVLTTEDISGSGRTKRGYRMPDVSFGPPMKGVQDLLNNSGYKLVYDSYSEGLEPIYFWVLDYMRDTYWG